MEDKKIKLAKEEKKDNTQKLTYEQLNDACMQLSQQNQQLYRQLQESRMQNAIKRMDYLFLVLQNAPIIKDAELINNCIAEIKESLFSEPEEENKEE